MAWIYAFAGNKGGPGKTSETLAMAEALAKRGRTVVVADMDAQGNATRRLGVDKASLLVRERPGIADLLDPRRPAHVSEVAVPCGWDEPWARNITVLPSLDRESLAERNEEGARPGASSRLRRALDADGWSDDVHDILIDTGPDVNHLLLMAFTAADRVVLVTTMNQDSIEGAVYLCAHIDTLRTLGLDHLSVAGVVVNAYDANAANQVAHLNQLPTTFLPWGGEGILWGPPMPVWRSLANSHDGAVPVASIRHVSAKEFAPVYDAHADRLIATQKAAV